MSQKAGHYLKVNHWNFVLWLVVVVVIGGYLECVCSPSTNKKMIWLHSCVYVYRLLRVWRDSCNDCNPTPSNHFVYSQALFKARLFSFFTPRTFPTPISYHLPTNVRQCLYMVNTGSNKSWRLSGLFQPQATISDDCVFAQTQKKTTYQPILKQHPVPWVRTPPHPPQNTRSRAVDPSWTKRHPRTCVHREEPPRADCSSNQTSVIRVRKVLSSQRKFCPPRALGHWTLAKSFRSHHR